MFYNKRFKPHGVVVPPVNISLTRTPRSLPVILGAAILPLFVGMTLVYYILTQLAGLSLTKGFAAQHISNLQTIVSSFDFFIPATFGIMYVMVLIRSHRIRSSPLLAFVGLLSLPVVVISTAYIGELAGFFTGLQVLGPALNNFQYSIVFFENIAGIATVAAVIVLFVMVGGGVLARR